MSGLDCLGSARPLLQLQLFQTHFSSPNWRKALPLIEDLVQDLAYHLEKKSGQRLLYCLYLIKEEDCGSTLETLVHLFSIAQWLGLFGYPLLHFGIGFSLPYPWFFGSCLPSAPKLPTRPKPTLVYWILRDYLGHLTFS